MIDFILLIFILNHQRKCLFSAAKIHINNDLPSCLNIFLDEYLKIDTSSSTIERKYCHPHGQQYQTALILFGVARNLELQ